MRILNEMKIHANKDEILKALRANRETHKKIVVEARKGYVAKAREALKSRLDALESGKIVSLAFRLSPPQDHTNVYDTAIRMLELSVQPTIELTSTQVQCLIQDDWDWKQGFLGSNAMYSGTAQAEYASKYEVSEEED
jgi:hypothetical protein